MALSSMERALLSTPIDSPDKGTAEIIIGKQRNGPIGKSRLTFLGKYTKFENFIPEMYASDYSNAGRE